MEKLDGMSSSWKVEWRGVEVERKIWIMGRYLCPWDLRASDFLLKSKTWTCCIQWNMVKGYRAPRNSPWFCSFLDSALWLQNRCTKWKSCWKAPPGVMVCPYSGKQELTTPKALQLYKGRPYPGASASAKWCWHYLLLWHLSFFLLSPAEAEKPRIRKVENVHQNVHY